MTRRIIRYVGKKAGSHPAIALSFAALVTAAALWAAMTRLTIEMDVAALLPKDSKISRETSKAEWLFGLGNYDFLLAAIEVKDSAPPEVRADPAGYLRSVQSYIASSFDDSRYFTRRTNRLRPRELSSLQANEAALVSLLTDGDFDRLESRLSPGRLRNTLEEIDATLADTPTSATLLALRDDPFGLEDLLEARSFFISGPLKKNYREGYYLSADGQMLVLVLWPVSPSTNLMAAREVVRFLEQTRTGLYKRNPDWRNKIDISFAGPHVENAEGTSDVRQDIILSSLVSFIAVMLLFVVAFRQPEALAFVAIPLIVGLIWTLGFTSLFVTRITQVTLTFAAILIGLGIDFSIHLYNRYFEDIRLGKSPEEALGSAIYNTGPSILAGAVTTGFSFFGMVLTEFQGFRELGLFGGIGILMSLIAVATILPPLMILSSRVRPRIYGPLATLGLKKVTFTVQSYPRMTVAAGLSVVAFLGMHATKITFNDDFQALRQPSDSYISLIQRIDNHFDLPSNQVLVIVEGPDPDGALAANDQLYENIETARSTFDLVAVDSLRTIYPSPSTQKRAIDRFLTLPYGRIEGDLRRLAEEYDSISRGFFDPFLQRFQEIQQQCAETQAFGAYPIEIGRITDRDFMDVVLGYLQHDAERNVYRVVTRIYPPPTPEWTEQVPPLFVESLGRNIQHKPLVLGNAVLSAELQHMIVRDLTIIVLVVFFSVTLYLAFYFRSLRRAGLAMIPIIFALLSTLGIMQLVNMRLNYLNIIAIPMIVGIGVDSAIHLLTRFYEGDTHNMRAAIEKTGRAIVITSLTTIFGFGSLSIASFSGIREIGILSIIGTACTLFAALIFLPAVLKLLDPKYTFSGGPGDEIG